MAENKLIVDKITTLRLLHDLRANMQKYAAGQASPQTCKTLIEGFTLFSDDENLAAKARALIASRASKVSFNPYAFKTTTEKEDEKRKKAVKKSAAQNKLTKMLQKQISEELAFQQYRGKMTDVPENPVFESVSADEQYFTVKVAGRDEPLQFPVKQNKGKHFSLLGVKALSDKTYAKKGFDEGTFQLLSELGEKGFTLEKIEVDDAGKKYSPSQYKSFLGLNAQTELSEEYKKELNILNSLSAADQRRFVLGVKKRRLEQIKNSEFFDELNKAKNPLLLLANHENLKNLYVKNGMDDCAQALQDKFIHKQIQPAKKTLWNYFNKTEDGNSRFAYYDILMNNIIAENADILKNIYDFNSQEEMKAQLINATQKVKKLSVPSLPDSLAAEILARGIFNNVINQNTNADKLKNMNLLLNEFGLNIKFDAVAVTKVPDMSIESAAQQSKFDRAAFEEDKKTPLSKNQDQAFKKFLLAQGIKHPDASSKHHFYALKYNAFIEEELNQSKNYVQTAREHPWNLDGHNMVHVFDTAGEFLVVDENQKYSLMDFNSLRKAFNAGKKLTLQIPILQVKDENAKFVNLLDVSKKEGECGMYVSSDKTPFSFIRLPEYCTSHTNFNNGNFR